MPKILVCGGQNFKDDGLVFRTLDAVLRKHGPDGLVIIHGACKTGADNFAESWAKSRQVAYMGVPARWAEFGRAAGPIRNRKMRDATRPDHCIAFRGGNGTRGMIALMREIGVEPWLVGWNE